MPRRASAKRFRCLAGDPPWLERGGGRSKRGADRHYPLMKTADIVDAMADALGMTGATTFGGGFGVATKWTHGPSSKVASDAHLWLWVTDNFLRDGLRVGEELGFRYVRTMVWVKSKRELDELDELDEADLQIGLGQYLRGSHELALLFTRGRAMVPKPVDRMPSVIVAPRGRHSAKPDKAFAVFERVSPGPRLELFARTRRRRWSAWGNEV